MKRSSIISCTSVILLIGITVSAWFYSSNIIAQISSTPVIKKYKGPTWEYKVLNMNTGFDWGAMEKKYNELGKNGWELVNFRQDVSVFKKLVKTGYNVGN